MTLAVVHGVQVLIQQHRISGGQIQVEILHACSTHVLSVSDLCVMVLSQKAILYVSFDCFLFFFWISLTSSACLAKRAYSYVGVVTIYVCH